MARARPVRKSLNKETSLFLEVLGKFNIIMTVLIIKRVDSGDFQLELGHITVAQNTPTSVVTK